MSRRDPTLTAAPSGGPANRRQANPELAPGPGPIGREVRSAEGSDRPRRWLSPSVGRGYALQTMPQPASSPMTAGAGRGLRPHNLCKPSGVMTKSPMSTLYERELDRFIVQEMKNPASRVPDNVYRNAQAAHALRIGEALLLADQVVFRVYGENVIVPLLVTTFGFEPTRRLITNGAVRFLLSTEDVVFVDSDEVTASGIDPLASIRLSDSTHTDPQASAETGLKGWNHANLAAKEQRHLARHVAMATRPLTQGVVQTLVPRVLAAYDRGDLSSFGFSPDTPLRQLTRDERQRLCAVASDLHEGIALVQEGMDLYEADDVWAALVCGCRHLNLQNGIHSTTQTVLALEGVPVYRFS